MAASIGWGILVAVFCALLAARYSSAILRRSAPTGSANRSSPRAPALQASAAEQKKQLWIQELEVTRPAQTLSRPKELRSEKMDVPGPKAGSSGGGGGGEGMPTPEQLRDLLSQAQSHLSSQDSGDGEAQVKAAMAALAAVRGVMVAQGRSEEEVMQALQTAAAEGRDVVASETRPGPNWRPLLPQDLGADASLLEETGRSSIIGEAAIDPESYVCPNCSGVVPRRRRSAHDEYWCSAIGGSDEEASAEDAR